MSTIVQIESVKSSCQPTEREIRKVGPYILANGLIEPLKLSRDGTIGRIDPWDAARLEFCRRAGWATVIVAYDNGE